MKIGIWGDGLVCDEWVSRIIKATPEDEFVNKSRPQETTCTLLADFAAQIEEIRPEAVLFAVGMYDIALKPGFETLVPTETFEANMQALVAKAKEYTERVYVLGLYKADESRGFKIAAADEEVSFSNSAIDTRDGTLFEMAKELRLAYIHIFDLIDSDTDTTDGLHLNDSGYTKAFSMLSPRLLDPELIERAKV